MRNTGPARYAAGRGQAQAWHLGESGAVDHDKASAHYFEVSYPTPLPPNSDFEIWELLTQHDVAPSLQLVLIRRTGIVIVGLEDLGNRDYKQLVKQTNTLLAKMTHSRAQSNADVHPVRTASRHGV